MTEELITITEVKPNDHLLVWLEDTIEPEGGKWMKMIAKPFEGRLCLWSEGFRYENFRHLKPLPIELYEGDNIKRNDNTQ